MPADRQIATTVTPSVTVCHRQIATTVAPSVAVYEIWRLSPLSTRHVTVRNTRPRKSSASNHIKFTRLSTS